MNTFSDETCLNVKHQCFIFQHIVQIYLNTYPSFWMPSAKKMMLTAVQATDEQLIAPPYLMWSSATFLHQTCIAGLVKHLSPYTGCIWEWTGFEQSPFAHRKRITECCSLRGAFNGNVTIFIVYKLHHSDVIVIKLTDDTQN